MELEMNVVFTKARVQRGKSYPATPTEYAYNITNGLLTIARVDKHDGSVKSNTFVVGNEAEYGSYNLRYTGTITKITDKCVTIVAYKGSRNETVHRLHMHEFCWRNYDFDAVATAAYNANEMMYI